MTHTDIKRQGWIQYLPQSWQPFAILMRIDRPIGWWLLLLPSWWGIILGAGGLSGIDNQIIFFMGLFLIGAILMRGAGCIINDLWDRDLDKKVERTKSRPLASGEVSIKGAVSFVLILLLMGLFILLFFPRLTVALGSFSIILVIAYPLMKRFTWWPQAFLGITFNFGALMGYSAVTGELSGIAILMYIAGIFWTLGYDTIYAIQDQEDDALVGIKSTARLFGHHVRAWITVFYSAVILILLASLILIKASIGAYLFLLLVGFYFYWQVKTLKTEESKNALRRFKINRDVGILICFMLLFM